MVQDVGSSLSMLMFVSISMFMHHLDRTLVIGPHDNSAKTIPENSFVYFQKEFAIITSDDKKFTKCRFTLLSLRIV